MKRSRCQFPVRWILQVVCVCSVIVSANHVSQSDEAKTNSYTAVLISSTTLPPETSSTPAEEELDPRLMAQAMMNMLAGKEKNWNFKKPGLLGTHHVAIKVPAQESIFCRLMKKQSMVMFSFCGGTQQGWGWKKKSDGGKKKKKGKKKGKKKSKKKGDKKKSKKKGEKKKGKKKGDKKKKKGGKKKGDGDEEEGWGWKPPPPKKKKQEGWGWQPPKKAEPQKGWEPPKEEKKKGGWGEKEESEEKGWMKEESEEKGWKEEEKGWKAEEEDEEVGDAEEEEEEEDEVDQGDYEEDSSQAEDYQSKKNYKKSTERPSIIIQPDLETTTASYLSEYELQEWETAFMKQYPEDIIHHHFYRDSKAKSTGS